MLSKHSGKKFAVVDLQNLGLNKIIQENGKIVIGATSTLTQIEAQFSGTDMVQAIQIQAGKNQRNSATIAGLVKLADGRSPVLTLLLALDAQIAWEPGNVSLSLGNWLPVRNTWKEAILISDVIVPEVKFVFDSIGRTPKDKPIVCCAIALWPNGRMRVSLGGYGKIPALVLDGTKDDNIEIAVRSALTKASDQWASAEYRQVAGEKMVQRLFAQVMAQ